MVYWRHFLTNKQIHPNRFYWCFTQLLKAWGKNFGPRHENTVIVSTGWAPDPVRTVPYNSYYVKLRTVFQRFGLKKWQEITLKPYRAFDYPLISHEFSNTFTTYPRQQNKRNKWLVAVMSQKKQPQLVAIISLCHFTFSPLKNMDGWKMIRLYSFLGG